ncbi:MAG: hypothetical protein Q9218_004797 [Villophora microphyllina]
MHLLHTRDLRLRYVITSRIVRYVILSHTWGDEEVSFQDIQRTECNQLKGYAKIEKCCEKAASMGYDYAWIDTCCIDKSSSAELSEAINSMYGWYRDAVECFVYLSDVVLGPRGTLEEQNFRHSRWFRRGWTLQELLAPRAVSFYDAKWEPMGRRIDLVDQISLATGIDKGYLENPQSIRQASVAARMSWAAYRQTTRLEDEAYCLMGLFDVSMPLLYGEGRRAFLRLQHEIARETDDESLFAWHTPLLQSGIFAPYPKAFAGSGDIVPRPLTTMIHRPPYAITNRGLAVEVDFWEVSSEHLPGFRWYRESELSDEFALFPLSCIRRGTNKAISILVKRYHAGDSFVRYFPCEDMHDEYYRKSLGCQHRTINIRGPLDDLLPRRERWPSTVSLPQSFEVWYVTPPGLVAESYDPLLRFGDGPGFAVLTLQRTSKSTLILVLKHVETLTSFRRNPSQNSFGPPPARDYTVTLHYAGKSTTVTATMNACREQSKFLRPVVENDEDQSIRTSDGSVITLKKQHGKGESTCNWLLTEQFADMYPANP